MKGSLVKRGKNRWAVVLDRGYVADAKQPGKMKRRQQWISVRGSKQDAEKKLADLVSSVNHGTLIEPSKLTLIEYLRAWVETIKPLRRPLTYAMYHSIIERHLANAPLGSMLLQKIRPLDVEGYYGALKLQPSTIGLHHAMLARALKTAVRDRLIQANPAVDAEDRPRVNRAARREAARKAWTAGEARAVLDAADKTTPQFAAFMYVALDSGARRAELAGLLWTDIDLDAGTVTIARQLDGVGQTPKFGPTKTKTSRTIQLNAETVTRLRAHKRAQAELKMQNRTVYQDHGLVFAKEHEHLHALGAALGHPIKTLPEKSFAKLVKAAGVSRIVFHGTRHTMATLSLQAGVPVHVVSQRLGHASPSMTLDVYSHALPGAQQDAAAKLAAVLHG
jgi:integrase